MAFLIVRFRSRININVISVFIKGLELYFVFSDYTLATWLQECFSEGLFRGYVYLFLSYAL